MLELGVVIVTWNVRDLALQALQSLIADLEQSPFKAFEVVVVDSASHDGTAEAVRAAFPQVSVIAHEENLGFGAGNNLGIAYLQAEHPGLRAVYLLNPDTITQPGATWALYEALFDEAEVGLVGARLTFGDGSFQHGAFMFPGLRQLWSEFFWIPGRWREGTFNGRYPLHLYQSSQPFDVDFTLGATMMLRSEVIDQTGMFDPGFFMYAEEVDWAWRIRKGGWRVQCVPAAHVVHLGGQSTGQVRPQSSLYLWQSRLRLFDKHYPPLKRRFARWIVQQGIRSRIASLTEDAPEIEALRRAYEQIYEMASA